MIAETHALQVRSCYQGLVWFYRRLETRMDSQCANAKRDCERPFPRRRDLQFPQNGYRDTKDCEDVESGDDGSNGVKNVLVDAVAVDIRGPEFRNRSALHHQKDHVDDTPYHAEGSSNPASLVQTPQGENTDVEHEDLYIDHGKCRHICDLMNESRLPQDALLSDQSDNGRNDR